MIGNDRIYNLYIVSTWRYCVFYNTRCLTGFFQIFVTESYKICNVIHIFSCSVLLTFYFPVSYCNLCPPDRGKSCIWSNNASLLDFIWTRIFLVYIQRAFYGGTEVAWKNMFKLGQNILYFILCKKKIFNELM